uniref:Uncharacterized protein n=1 Tax=Rhizophora mucronata TaxID=61149 RepID=A0A2P2QUM7_RHIMU
MISFSLFLSVRIGFNRSTKYFCPSGHLKSIAFKPVII